MNIALKSVAVILFGIAALVLKERLNLLIQESRRVLLNGGALFITVPDDTNYNIDVIRQLFFDYLIDS